MDTLVEADTVESSPDLQQQSSSDIGTGMTRVWLVDDYKKYRILLAEILNGENDFVCERQFSSAESLLEALQRETAPDVIILDIEMSGLSGLDAIRPIKSLAPRTHVVMLSAFSDTERLFRAFREGASDFLLKTYRVDKLLRRIRELRHQPPALSCSAPEDGKVEQRYENQSQQHWIFAVLQRCINFLRSLSGRRRG